MPEKKPGQRGRAAIYRILDANLNRFCEGLRVVEDTLRFALGRPGLAGKAKALRHSARELFRSAVQRGLLLLHRETGSDPGRHPAWDQMNPGRRGLGDLLQANFKRVQESLRVIEEYSRLAMPAATVRFKTFRFDSYALEKATMRAAAVRGKRS